MVSLIHGGLLLQIALGYGIQLNQADDWILGYAFGFSDGVLQASGVADQPSCLATVRTVFQGLFSNPRLAQHQLDRALELQRSPEFSAGALLGCEQALALVRDRQPPMGLARRLQELAR